MTPYPKRLIEVDLPIKKISEHSRREKSIRHGHISTLHIWWARRPLAACRAVICAALWVDPADPLCPEKFRRDAAALMKRFFDPMGTDGRNFSDPLMLRGALLDFIADFANWDNSTKKEYLDTSRALTQSAHESLCGAPGSESAIGDWRDVLQELPVRIHEWMPRLAQEGVVGADAIFACLGPALKIFSRYSRVEKASGDVVPLREYLEYVWAAVAKEALAMIFQGADATGFEEDARLTAMWLWTLSTGMNGNGNKKIESEIEDDEDAESSGKSPKMSGFVLEYDAARKIAQGLGAHLEALSKLIEIKGDKARLLPVDERKSYLFGKEDVCAPKRKKKEAKQLTLTGAQDEAGEEADLTDELKAPPAGTTVLDRLHQAMLLFDSGQGEALKRFLVEDGIGKDERFWRLAQAFSALYPAGTDEKRWVEGLMARKKGLGF